MVSFLIPLFVVLGLGMLIATLVYVVIKLRNNQPLGLSLHSAAAGYFYLISIISLVVMVLGLAALLNAGLSTVLGREFSYRAMAVYKQRPVTEGMEPAERARIERLWAEHIRRLERDFRNGLVRGASLTVVGGLVWGLHLYGRRRLEGRLLHRDPSLNRAYLWVLLALFSIGGIIMTPWAVYDTLRYYLVEPTADYERATPGNVLSAAIVFIPFWVYYYLALIRHLRSNNQTVKGELK